MGASSELRIGPAGGEVFCSRSKSTEDAFKPVSSTMNSYEFAAKFASKQPIWHIRSNSFSFSFAVRISFAPALPVSDTDRIRFDAECIRHQALDPSAFQKSFSLATTCPNFGSLL